MTSSSLFVAYGALLTLASFCVYVSSFAALHTPVSTRKLRREAGYATVEDDGTEDAESLSSDSAWLFPVFGSAALLVLFLAFRYFDKDVVNLLLSAYFAVVSLFAIPHSVALLGKLVLGAARWRHLAGAPFTLTLELARASRETESPPAPSAPPTPPPKVVTTHRVKYDYTTVALALGAAVLIAGYMVTKHWVLANCVAICFAVQGITLITLDTFFTGFLLLGGLFFYDIFWVFGTPVMVSVATKFDAPIKILWPRNSLEILEAIFKHGLSHLPKDRMALLGLGDIVIPGVVVALALRYDQTRASVRSPSLSFTRTMYAFPKPYFTACFAAYVAGLAVTMTVMHVFSAAQPALLYLSPACSLALVAVAAARGELSDMWSWSVERLPGPRLQPAERPPGPSRSPAAKRARVTRSVVDPISGAVRVESAPEKRAHTALQRMLGESHDDERPRRNRKNASAVEDQEEDEIAWLEHQLYGKRKARTAAPEGEDIDFLIGDLDRFQEVEESEGSEEAEESEAEEIRGGDGEASDEERLFSDEDEDEWRGGDASGDEGGVELDEGPVERDEGVGEDRAVTDTKQAAQYPEVPQVDASKRAASKYIPPAMRAAADRDSKNSADQQKLRRHINGPLNRLAEGNLDTVVGELDVLYGTFARGDVTAMAVELVLDTVASERTLSETIIVLYAALIAAMHRIVGVEFGAYFLQECVTRLFRTYGGAVRGGTSGEAASRKCVNLLLLLCHGFNLKMLSSGILYDLVRLFLRTHFADMVPGLSQTTPLAEVDIELLLRIVKTSGAQLRHEDAESLKAIAELTKQQLDDAPEESNVAAHSSRARFMLEALLDLRYHRKQQGAAATAATSESERRMAKYLSSLPRRHTVRAHARLQVGLKDLQDAASKGRWWLVGAAWAGHGTDAAATQPAAAAPAAAATDARAPDEGAGSDLARLARAQGMNTDARRSVFTTIMSSLDYRDAVDSLLQLKLSEVQRREIIRVLVHCLGSEHAYNPYYVLIGQHLAQELPSMRITMQYVLWDYFRALGEKRVGGERTVAQADVDDDAHDHDAFMADPAQVRRLLHLARAYAWWFAKGALSLQVLKPVDWTALQPTGATFLQHLFVQMLLATQTKIPLLTDRSRAQLERPPSPSDQAAVEHLFVQGTVGQPALAQGVLVFFRTRLRRSDIVRVTGSGEAAFLKRVVWCVETAAQTVSVGSSSAAQEGC
ncbi:suppressor of glycerol defect [Malassezia sp. CBS 17886]|nr:suppressor of glycerol defect [Malassezia sp. CBS 17886]